MERSFFFYFSSILPGYKELFSFSFFLFEGKLFSFSFFLFEGKLFSFSNEGVKNSFREKRLVRWLYFLCH
ncbi:hypothetical protein BRADI_3g54286v3 [Brachypodium distachyon]|uniref:Uncharacterized protein n=1 Tax=Brachypodium distachyon TaxID=15368 RepID=A0A2K2D4Z2_BRADI|nr:hypothetical protein BRADI_3g54286v3 [Brachypodium distachyon]